MLRKNEVSSVTRSRSRIQERISQFSATTGNLLMVVSMKARWLFAAALLSSQISRSASKSQLEESSQMHEEDELDHGQACPCHRYFLLLCNFEGWISQS
jgi:hypothetical protein